MGFVLGEEGERERGTLVSPGFSLRHFPCPRVEAVLLRLFSQGVCLCVTAEEK